MIKLKHCALLGAIVLAPHTRADSALEYLLTEPHADTAKAQPVLVKDGQVLIKGAGGDANLDLLYTRAQERVIVIDHRHRTLMALDERQFDRLAQQAETFQPLLQGLGEQLGKLTPEQRGKWEQMLGGKVDLGQLAGAAQLPKALNVVNTGVGKQVAGIACQQINVVENKKTRAEFCLADPNRLSLSGDDYATLRSLLGLSERLAAKGRGLAGRFGIKIPAIALNQLEGVPIEMQDLSKDKMGTLTLNRVSSTAVDEALMRVPNGYRNKELDFLK
ncbi:hypothetical protein [Methylococcus sp. EFPC2]|uniref:hypothetical protein n=1 Tax=Methylococcus sp. EFPC2 TaxID=2812648 RepID=UPI0019687525|nr:hypothetical protein [Methylococcus sp. EFPC2]QSA98558.1 hypothetical protein JWZ97_07105 [Methylococcus sp. EFPC2]